MKTLKFVSLIACSLLWACQSNDIEPMPVDDATTVADVDGKEPVQVTEDVNSTEVENILDLIFDNKTKSRAEDYDIRIIKDSKGNDRIICINFSDNNGYALVSALKSYDPILAYAETGHFSETDSLPLPVKAWMENTVNEIGESITLPADSLAKIASKWRQFEAKKPSVLSRADEVDPDHSKFYNLTPEEYQRLFHIMKPYVDSWVADGYRVYSVDDYNEPIAIGDKFAVAGYVQGRIIPIYFDDYWAVTVVRTKEVGLQSGVGHWMKTTWGQEGQYNKFFPLIPNGQGSHIPVGCGVLAVGQVMFAYKYPNTFDWTTMPYNEGSESASWFLLDVYNKCNAFYDVSNDGTACYQKDRVKALTEYGYTCGEIRGGSLTEHNLLNGCPAILSGTFDYNTSDPKDHAWVIEGPKIYNSYREIEIWTFTYQDTFSCVYHEESDPTELRLLYANWGYDGEYNGYYSFSSMLPCRPKQKSNDNKLEYKYNNVRLTEAMTSIRPNK